MEITPIQANSNASVLFLMIHDDRVPSYILCRGIKPLITKCWTCCLEGFDFHLRLLAGALTQSDAVPKKSRNLIVCCCFFVLFFGKFTGFILFTSCFQGCSRFLFFFLNRELALTWPLKEEVLYFPQTCFCNSVCQHVTETCWHEILLRLVLTCTLNPTLFQSTHSLICFLSHKPEKLKELEISLLINLSIKRKLIWNCFL